MHGEISRIGDFCKMTSGIDPMLVRESWPNNASQLPIFMLFSFIKVSCRSAIFICTIKKVLTS